MFHQRQGDAESTLSHPSFTKGAMPISDCRLSHTRQMTWNVSEDAFRESAKIRATPLQMLPRGRWLQCGLSRLLQDDIEQTIHRPSKILAFSHSARLFEMFLARTGLGMMFFGTCLSRRPDHTARASSCGGSVKSRGIDPMTD